VTIRTHFAFDSTELTAEDKAELDRVAARLTELEFVGGTATGHTDSVGDEAYNQKLSERRGLPRRQCDRGGSFAESARHDPSHGLLSR
jgi:hypothetical protein